MEPAALPLRIRERAEQCERHVSAPAEGAEGIERIVAAILTLFRPPLLIEWMLGGRPDPPGRELLGVGADDEDRRIVEREDRVEAAGLRASAAGDRSPSAASMSAGVRSNAGRSNAIAMV